MSQTQSHNLNFCLRETLVWPTSTSDMSQAPGVSSRHSLGWAGTKLKGSSVQILVAHCCEVMESCLNTEALNPKLYHGLFSWPRLTCYRSQHLDDVSTLVTCLCLPWCELGRALSVLAGLVLPTQNMERATQEALVEAPA